MSVPKTMFQLSGRGYAAANLSHATLVIIDAQKEYLSGPLALSGMDAAVGNIKQGVGKVTGNDKLRAEGVVQEKKGEVQKAVGDTKDAVKKATK